MADPIPPRSTDSDNPPLTGTQIAARIQSILGDTRSVSAGELARRRAQVEEFVFQQFSLGNVPNFMRPENYREINLEMQIGGRTVQTAVRVCPDYLALGSNGDFLRVPINPLTARRIGDRFGLAMPTPRLVDAIDVEARRTKATGPDGNEHTGIITFIAAPAIARQVIDPATNTPVHDRWNYKKYGAYEGQWMLSPEFLIKQSRMMDDSFRASGNPSFRSGSKKDVVYDPLALVTAGEGGMPVVIYRPGVQGLSNIHNELYWDYSHGIRFLDRTVRLTITQADGSQRTESMDIEVLLNSAQVFQRRTGPEADMYKGLYRLFAAAPMDINQMYRGTQTQPPRRTEIQPQQPQSRPVNVQFGEIEIHRGQNPRQTY